MFVLNVKFSLSIFDEQLIRDMENKNNIFIEHQSDTKISLDAFIEFCDNLSESIIITDNENKILFTNTSFQENFGFSNDQIKNNKIDKLFLNERPVNNLGKRYEAEMVHKNGSQITCELKVVSHLTEDKQTEWKVYFVQNLSDSLEQKKELKEYEDKFQTLFNEIKDVLYESTPDGNLIDMNPAGLELFGYKNKEDLLKVDIAEELYLNPYDRTKFKNQLEKEGYVKDYEIGVRRRDGTIATVLETAFAVKDETGEVTRYRGIIRDITDNKNYEAKLRKYIDELGQVNKQLITSEEELKNLNAAKDKFFSIVAHDLRSPFTSLIGYSEFLKDDLADLSDEEIELFANNIHESSQTVFNLLENLLQWSRVQTGRIKIDPELYDFHQLAESTIKLLGNNANKKKINLQNKIPPRTLVYSDQQTISSVLQNLVSNAIKFTPKEGKIEIVAKYISEENVEISVSDTGVGIKHDDLDKLFKIDAHLTTHGTEDEEGSGLGLILCKELVEKNKGRIKVQSDLGKGSTFSFTLRTQG